jgi:DNA-binding HxlR family transcriptional regulator
VAFTALFCGQAWAIANRLPLPTPRQYQEIQKQLHDINSNAMVWDKLNNQEQQELVEKLAYPLIIQRSHYRAYLRENRTAAIAEMSEKVQEGMKGFNLNMRALQLGDTGLRDR